MAGEMKSKKRRARKQKALNAGIAGAVMGAIGGAIIGFSLGAAWQGAIIGMSQPRNPFGFLYDAYDAIGNRGYEPNYKLSC